MSVRTRAVQHVHQRIGIAVGGDDAVRWPRAPCAAGSANRADDRARNHIVVAAPAIAAQSHPANMKPAARAGSAPQPGSRSRRRTVARSRACRRNRAPGLIVDAAVADQVNARSGTPARRHRRPASCTQDQRVIDADQFQLFQQLLPSGQQYRIAASPFAAHSARPVGDLAHHRARVRPAIHRQSEGGLGDGQASQPTTSGTARR